jgi:hypothetical protein
MSGPTGRYSITMPRDVAEAAGARSGPSGLSQCGRRAWRVGSSATIRRDLRVAEAEHGPVSEEEIRTVRERLERARAEQTPGGANTA